MAKGSKLISIDHEQSAMKWEGPRIFFTIVKITFDLLRHRVLMLLNENKKNFADLSKRSKDMTKNVMYTALEMVTKKAQFCQAAASKRALI